MNKRLMFFFIIFFSHSVLADKEINLSLNKLLQLARHLEVAEPELKYEFSRIALIEMYYAYQDEIKRSLEDKYTDLKRVAKVRHWRYATMEYLENLDKIFFEIDSGGSLDFYISPQNKIIILVSGKPVIVTGPNAGGNKKIENNVVEQFCLSFDCRAYFDPILPIKPEKKLKNSNKNINDTYDYISGTWSMNEDHPADFITSHGITYRFKSISNRDKKEQWSINLSNDLLLIVEQLKAAKRRNATIHWSALSLHDLPLTDNAYKLIINDSNEYLKVPVKHLGKIKKLLPQLQEWLKSHFDKATNSRIIIDNADDYF